MESNDSPKLKGVVIITLPPPDNPSLGKTITAFTLSDSPHESPSEANQTHYSPEQAQPQPQMRPQTNPENENPYGRVRFGAQRAVLGILGVSLFALILWVYESPEMLSELRKNEDNDRQPNSFVFPLYRKTGVSQGDFELKLGRFVDSNYVVGGMRHEERMKSVSTISSRIDSTSISPVRGNVYPDGLYYTYMLVGSPPRPYFLDMDTGSDLTWVQCDAPCTSCAKGAHPFYKPTRSKILPSKDSLCVEVQRSRTIGHCETCHQCDYEIEYADQSSSIGVLAKDEIHLMIGNGSLVKSNSVFGCAYDQQGLLLNALAKTDGILGLSRAKISLPSQLASQGIVKNVVGHCLTSDAKAAGYMFLGDDFVPYWKMAWVPMLNSASMNFYHTEVMKMSYGSRQLSLGALNNGVGCAVFDSGSSYTYFTSQAYANLLKSLEDDLGDDLILDTSDLTLPICWQAKFPIRSVKDVKRFFKPLTLQLGSKWWLVSSKLHIPPEGYLIVSNKGNVCLGVLDGSKVHDGSTIILGGISLHGRLIVYDNVKQRIGWMPSDCVKPWRIKNHPFF